MFKFGFSSDEQDEPKQTTLNEEKVTWFESKEINPTLSDIFKNSEEIETCKLTFNNVEIHYLLSSDVYLNLINDSEETDTIPALKAEENHSDLDTAKYEGGLKIWECTYDLINFIHKSKLSLEKKKVLDLGCGSGLVGIYALLHGATCFFQDYNEEVLKYITIPNVALNEKQSEKSLNSNSKYYSGDWMSFLNLIKEDFSNENDKFDYIFTSETIYNTDNYEKLISVFKTLLKQTGVIYVAAKSYYFGVGGGIDLFKDKLENEKVFNYSTCWICNEGVNREIFEIKFIS